MAKILLIGGGTFSYVRAHLAIATPAFGHTVRDLESHLENNHNYDFESYFTKMADPTSTLVTNEDVKNFLLEKIKDTNIKILILNVAFTDFEGQIGDVKSSKTAPRLISREGPYSMDLFISEKVVNSIQNVRPDLKIVSFKTCCDNTHDEMYSKGINLLNESNSEWVFVNDISTYKNMLIFKNKQFLVGERNVLFSFLVNEFNKIV